MRPIPVDIVPAHIYLSAQDQVILFGSGYAMTVDGELSQPGQHYYEEMVEVQGKGKRTLRVHVLGPNWERSFVELTRIEATYLGINAKEALSGDLSNAQPCTLIGPRGSVTLKYGVIIPLAHLRCSPIQARELQVANADVISVELLGQRRRVIDQVVVRIHPAFQLRVELNADHAREFWIERSSHAQLLDRI